MSTSTEKTAFELAYGAALAGARALTAPPWGWAPASRLDAPMFLWSSAPLFDVPPVGWR